MALWQYDIYLIPKDSSKKGVVNIYEIHEYWTGFKLKDFDFINDLPKGNSWSKDLIICGDLNSICLEILVEEQKVLEMKLRVNFSKDSYKSAIEFFFDKIYQNNLQMVDFDGSIFPMNKLSIINQIKNSEKFKLYNSFLNKKF